MAAAIYLHRAGLAPLVLERGEQGGLLRNANLVENYPGFAGGIKGSDLVERFSAQLDMLGIKVTKANVELVESSAGAFNGRSDAGEFTSRSLILATGTRPKRVRLRGSGRLLGTKVFDELVELPLEHLASKRILVIGGGDAAFDYALNLLGRGCAVTIISRSKPKCLSLLRARAETGGANIVTGTDPDLVKDSSNGVLLFCKGNKGEAEFQSDYILLACGREPNTEMLSPALRRRAGVVSDIPRTVVPGLFMAGDVVRGSCRQTGIAVGDGICAAMLAEEFLKKVAGAP